MVVEQAVVRHMAVRHNQTVVTYDCFAFAGSASVDSGALTDSGVVADIDIGLLAVELQVLRHGTYDRRGEDMAVPADTHALTDSGVGVDNCTRAYLDILVDTYERTYLYRRVYLGFRVDKG